MVLGQRKIRKTQHSKHNIGRLSRKRISGLEVLIKPIVQARQGDDKTKTKVDTVEKDFGLGISQMNHSNETEKENNSESVSEKFEAAMCLSDDSKLSDEDSFENIDFVAYDELANRKNSVGAAASVSNCSVRDAYFDLPNKYTDAKKNYFYNKQDIVFRDKATKKIIENEDDTISNDNESDACQRSTINDEEPLVDEELMNKRREVYSTLKRTNKALGLNVVIETLPKFQQQYPMYTFFCSKLFRRDQYKWHYKNTHTEIHSGLDGWMMQRCPLAQYGCPYVSYRLKPVSINSSVYFNRVFKCFGICMNKDSEFSSAIKDRDSKSIIDLPVEVIELIVSYLDNLSLNCFAKTCQLLKSVCFSMLDKRGIVVSGWEKRIYENGSSSWKQDKPVSKYFIYGLINAVYLDQNNSYDVNENGF